MDRDQFYVEVAQALSGCQLVEQQLKLYISEALELVNKCIGNRMVFKMNGEDYQDSSLDRLINVFKKLTNNAQLIAELDLFKHERNVLSHKGITHCLDYDGDLSFSIAREYEVRLAAIQVEAVRLRRALHNEGEGIRTELDFGFLSKHSGSGGGAT